MGLIDPRHHWLATYDDAHAFLLSADGMCSVFKRLASISMQGSLGRHWPNVHIEAPTITDLREPPFVRSRLAKRSVRDGNCWMKDRWTLRRDNNPVLGHTRSFLSGHEDCCHRRWQLRLRSHSQAFNRYTSTAEEADAQPIFPCASFAQYARGGVGMLCFTQIFRRAMSEIPKRLAAWIIGSVRRAQRVRNVS
jgi:hypothetical protein